MSLVRRVLSLACCLVVLFQGLGCQRDLSFEALSASSQDVTYRIPDNTQSLAWALELLTYDPLLKFHTPIEVEVIFEECDGDVNAYYFGLTHKISVCYPLLTYFDSIMEHDAALSAMMWVLGHEVGHAVVGITDMPVIRGEDVADSFAVWYSTEAQSLAAMMWFSDRADDGRDHDPYDPHSAADVRLANVQCWLYGKTENLSYWVSPWYRDCKEEWKEIDAFWTAALASSQSSPALLE